MPGNGIWEFLAVIDNSWAFKFLKLSPFRIGCLIILISGLLFYSFGDQKPAFLVALDNQIIDTMFRWRGSLPTTDSVVIVDIDEKSLKQEGQWPWPRTVVADLVKQIHHAGARAIGFDIVFAEKDRTSPKQYIEELETLLNDQQFLSRLEALKENDTHDHDFILGNIVAEAPVVLGYVFQLSNDGLKQEEAVPFPSCNIKIDPDHFNYDDLSLLPAYRAILNVDDIAQAESEGFFNVFPDATGTIRKVPLLMELNGIPYPSLALELLRIGLGVDEITIHGSQMVDNPKKGILGVSLGYRFVPTDDNGQVTVNYRGPHKTFPYVSAVDVLSGKQHEHLKNKYVLIGTSAAGLSDLRAIPFANSFPGVEVQASIIDNIIAGDPLTHDIYTEIGITYTLIIVGGLLISGLLAYTGPLVGGITGLMLIVAAVVGNYQFFFLRNELVGLIYPLFTVFGVFLIVTLFNYFVEDKKKRFIHKAFNRYVSPQVVGQLIKSPDRLSLAGEQKNLTVLFSDIRGFTGISEQMDSERLGLFMNKYLTAMSDIIMEYNGTVDKFIGDAIMAIWGAPLDQENHPLLSIQASLSMIERLKALQEDLDIKDIPAIDIGIGINTGIMSVGNFGSNRRFDYTVIGDNVNLASRLEGLNKIYGTNIIISEYTRDALDNQTACRYLDRVRVKGKEQPVKIYEPLPQNRIDISLKKEMEVFEYAIDDYLAQDFDKAHGAIEELNNCNPIKLYDLYLNRIHTYQEKRPPADWDGVAVWATK